MRRITASDGETCAVTPMPQNVSLKKKKRVRDIRHHPNIMAKVPRIDPERSNILFGHEKLICKQSLRENNIAVGE